MSKPQPIRTCIATGQESPPEALLRFVAGPQGQPFPDYTAKLPGRGAWLIPTAQNYALALKKKAFARHLETTQPPPPWEEITAQLTARALQALGLAKRGGQLVVGLEGCMEQSRRLKALLLAADAAENTAQKAVNLAPLTCRAFTKLQLEQALGVPNTTVVGLLRLDTAWNAVQKAANAQGIHTESTAPHDQPNTPPSA